MKSIQVSLLLLCAFMTLSGCSGYAVDNAPTEKLAIDQVSAPFSPGAITVSITAEPGLNAWNEIANSCTLLVIQAQKASSLNILLSNPAQLKNLFNGTGAQDDILKVDRYSAMPGQQTTLHIDRNENTRNIAIVAGYYPFPQKQHMLIISIPVTTTSVGWWTKKWSAQLSPLILDLTLGSQSITRLINNSSPQNVQAPAELQAVLNSPDKTSTQGEK